MPIFAPLWESISARINRRTSWQKRWALTVPERLRLHATLDALVANSFGLTSEQFGWLLKDCDHPVQSLVSPTFAERLDGKGFWRVEQTKDPELRHTVLAQVAFADLQRQGLDAFLAGPNGDGWEIPETLRLADYGLGHDDRAREHQPVAARMGPRFLPWQLEKDAATSWAECEAHAKLLDDLWRHARSLGGVTETRDEGAGAVEHGKRRKNIQENPQSELNLG